MSCTQFYIDMFHQLEGNGLLDFESRLDRFALHFVFLPRLNRSLAEFQAAWNSHGLRSEGSSTPLQLWAAGMIQLYGTRDLDLIRDEPDHMVDDWERYGVELEDGQPALDTEQEIDRQTPQTKALAELALPPGQAVRLSRLLAHLDPLQDVTDHGQTLFRRVRDTVHHFCT